MLLVNLVAAAPVLGAERGFPEAWVGSWSGLCKLNPPYDGKSELAMGLEIQPKAVDLWTWTIRYGKGPHAEIRAYELKRVPESAGRARYFVDEGGGVLLEVQPQGALGRLTRSLFSVQGRWISTRDELRGDTLVEEMASFAADHLSANGVQSMRQIALQECVLKR